MSHSIGHDGTYAHFNSDLSGDVTFMRDGEKFVVPAELVVKIVASFRMSNLISAIESMDHWELVQ